MYIQGGFFNWPPPPHARLNRALVHGLVRGPKQRPVCQDAFKRADHSTLCVSLGGEIRY